MRAIVTGMCCLAAAALAMGEPAYVMSHVPNVQASVRAIEISREGAKTLVRLVGPEGQTSSVIDVSRASRPKVLGGPVGTPQLQKSRRLEVPQNITTSADDPSRELKYVVNDAGFWIVSYRDLERERERISATQALYAP